MHSLTCHQDTEYQWTGIHILSLEQEFFLDVVFVTVTDCGIPTVDEKIDEISTVKNIIIKVIRKNIEN